MPNHGSRIWAVALCIGLTCVIIIPGGVSRARRAVICSGAHSSYRNEATSACLGGTCCRLCEMWSAASDGSMASRKRRRMRDTPPVSSKTHLGGGCSLAIMRRHAKTSGTISSTCASPSSVSVIVTTKVAKSECDWVSPAISSSAQPLRLRSDSSEPTPSCPKMCET